MAPILEPKDIVFIQPAAQCEKGDIVAIRHPHKKTILIKYVKEVDENNRFPSKLVTFGDSGPIVDEDEEDDGLLPAPSLISSIALLGAIAILRRR